MLGIRFSEFVSLFILMVVGLTFFRAANEIAAVLAVGLLFFLKATGLVLLAVTIMFIAWSLYEIFR